jgi:hypothetical protein
VYTAEQGRAGIGPHQLMITHFRNPLPKLNGKVTFEGRYFDDVRLPPATWSTVPDDVTAPNIGTVDGADYQGVRMAVTAVSETGTAVQWTLLDPRTKTTVHPVGDLTVYISLFIRYSIVDADVRNHTETYALKLRHRSAPPSHNPTAPDKRSPETYDLSWSTVAGAPATPPVSYCFDAAGNADSVVFQQGIVVDPASGAVTHDTGKADNVTMSCWLGAPATVYSWGYDYRAGDPFYFGSGILMKRASYCANAQYFTVAGTQIGIADDQHIQPPTPSTSPTPDLSRVEAAWSLIGATCLNPENMRHYGMGFSGICKERKLPRCTSQNTTGQFLLDAPLHPAP